MQWCYSQEEHGIVQTGNLFSIPNISKKNLKKKININSLFLHVSNTSKASSKSLEENLHQAMEMADTAVQPRELECYNSLEPAATRVEQNVTDESKAFKEKSYH